VGVGAGRRWARAEVADLGFPVGGKPEWRKARAPETRPRHCAGWAVHRFHLDIRRM